jgi:uncharacterized protein (DUF1330 family)
MTQTVKLLFALLLGIAIGAWAIPTLKAQPQGSQTYIVAATRVVEPLGFTDYIRGEPATLGQYHGQVLARALPDVREGVAPDGFVTIYGFANPEDANRWYTSPELAKIISLRQHAAKSQVYFLTGIVQQP